MGHKTSSADVWLAFARYQRDTGDAGARITRLTPPNDPAPSVWRLELRGLDFEIHGVAPTFNVIEAMARSWKEGFAAGREAP